MAIVHVIGWCCFLYSLFFLITHCSTFLSFYLSFPPIFSLFISPPPSSLSYLHPFIVPSSSPSLPSPVLSFCTLSPPITLSVDAGFDDNDIPYDVLWLDIEHTDGKKYLTWDSGKFPHPDQMQDKLAAKGRKVSLDKQSW